jgi:hypothetical protein
MRVRFGELSERELALRARLCSQAQRAWGELRRGNAPGARELIDAIDPRLALYVERSDGTARSCAALGVDDSSAWPLAELLLEQAPADVGCTLALGRAALPLDLALAQTRAAHGVALDRASLRVGFARGHLLEVTLGVPGGVGAEIEQIAAESLVQALLGERVFETWIGAVHATPAPRGGALRMLDERAGASSLGLVDLLPTVAAATRGALLGLPERALAEQVTTDASAPDAKSDWTLLEVEPFAEAAPDRKHDLLLASTATPELLRCFMEGQPCSSRRFSRAGERFVFLSYADAHSKMEQRIAERTRLEAALADTLKGVGAVSGVGLGVHTTYLDFALCDLEAGLERLVSSARELALPRHSFVQFFDSELSEEWVSIWPDSRLEGT